MYKNNYYNKRIDVLAVRRLVFGVSVFLAAWFYVASTGWLSQQSRSAPVAQMSIDMPLPVQVVLAGGDRYLAANIGAFRAMVVGVERLDAITLKTLSQVQMDAAALNPGHEDNYYMATAILPWGGHVAPAQTVLQAATAARPTDVYPPFFYGFNLQYFLHDPVAASQALQVAAQRADEGNRAALKMIAAKWVAQSTDSEVALAVLSQMKEEAKEPELKQVFAQRMERVKNMALLRDGVRKYRQEFGVQPASLDRVVAAGLLDAIPQDPLGGRYEVDRAGLVAVVMNR